MKVQTAVCDFAGCGVKGDSYEVKFSEGTLRADLCRTHSSPLRELRDALPKALFARTGTRRKAIRIVVDPNAV